jgi:hypothetical protein
MSDTVRDAVFGNVGTMICFRVSADDAPILSKQFEPQFEPNDLLQMHNRNFIINMVIKGEKSPAFSASTLTLPPAQADNSSLIIENTRRNYSRNRADVEAEIDKAIQPPQHLQSKKAPLSPAQAKQWPINAQTQTVTPNKIVFKTDTPAPITTPAAQSAGVAPTAEQGTAEGTAAPAPEKKKRTRTRRRKSAAARQAEATGEQQPAPHTPAPKLATAQQGSAKPQQDTPHPAPKSAPKADDGILHLR